MNLCVFMGRLCADPTTSNVNTANGNMTIARFRLAVDRRTKDNQADYISCVAFGKIAEFAQNYLKKGTKVVLQGHVQTGSYTDKNGMKVYTTDIVSDSIEFAESKAAAGTQPQQDSNDGFMNIPDNVDDEGLPFN